MRHRAACVRPSSSRTTSRRARRRGRRGSSTAACDISSRSTCRWSARRSPNGAGSSATRRTSSRLEPQLFPIYGIPFLHKAFYDAGLTLYDVLGARHDGGWHRRLDRSRPRWRSRRPLRQERAARRPAVPRRDRGRRAVHAGRPAHRARRPTPRRSRSRGSGRRASTRQALTARCGRCARATCSAATSSRSGRRRSSTRPGVWAADPASVRRAPRCASCPAAARTWSCPATRIPATAGLTIRVPGQGRVPRPVARPLADRHDRRAIRRTAGPIRPPTAGRSTSCSRPSTRRSTSTCSRDDVVGTYAGLRPLIAPSRRLDREGIARASRHGRAERRGPDRRRQVHDLSGHGARRRSMRRSAARRARAPERDRRAPTRSARPTARARPARRRARDDPGGRRRASRRRGTPRRAPRDGGARRRGARRASSTCCGRSSPGRPFLEAEVAWAVRHELALSVDDVLSRRLRLSPEMPDRGASVAPRVAAIMARELGWTDGAREREARRPTSTTARARVRGGPAGLRRLDARADGWSRRPPSATRRIAPMAVTGHRCIDGHASRHRRSSTTSSACQRRDSPTSSGPDRLRSRRSWLVVAVVVAWRLGWFAAARRHPRQDRRGRRAGARASSAPRRLVSRIADLRPDLARRAGPDPGSRSRSSRRRRARARATLDGAVGGPPAPTAPPTSSPTSTPFVPATVASGEFEGTDDFHFGRGTASIDRGRARSLPPAARGLLRPQRARPVRLPLARRRRLRGRRAGAREAQGDRRLVRLRPARRARTRADSAARSSGASSSATCSPSATARRGLLAHRR